MKENLRKPRSAPPDQERQVRLEVEKTKVLYVVGPGRSGSTILGQTLGAIEGFFAVGELYYLWDRGLTENRLCGCGAFFRDCPVWRAILTEAFGGIDRVDARELLRLRAGGPSNRRLLLAAARGSRGRRRRGPDRYGAALDALYGAARRATGSRVLVDTSKSPAYGVALDGAPGIDLYVLHLVRDPRAIAYSWWARRKPQPASGERPARPMTAHNPLESSLMWGATNFLVERVKGDVSERYMLLRYEDLVGYPRAALQRILDFVGEGEAPLPLDGEREVSLGTNHIFSGNPTRLRGGKVRLEADEEWRWEMGLAQKALVAATTWPGLLRYGYRLAGGRP